MLGIEKKDLTLKLFGKTIQVGSNSSENISVDDEQSLAIEPTIIKKEDEETSSSIVLQQSKTQTSQSSKTSPSCKHIWQREDYSTDQTSSSTITTNNNSQDHNVLEKKPLKPISCPRCTSMCTKFCYFNNYNVNQPRYFCKDCQRYWTNGGSMRNMPVGAGRRKSKKTSIFHHPPLLERHNHNSSSSDSLGSTSLASLTLKLMQKPQGYLPHGSFNMLQLTRIGNNGCYNPNQYGSNSGFEQPFPVLLGKHPRDETQVQSSNNNQKLY